MSLQQSQLQRDSCFYPAGIRSVFLRCVSWPPIAARDVCAANRSPLRYSFCIVETLANGLALNDTFTFNRPGFLSSAKSSGPIYDRLDDGAFITANLYVKALALFLGRMIDNLIMLNLFHIGTGILVAQSDQPGSPGCFLKVVSRGIVVILGALAIALFTLQLRFVSGFRGGYPRMCNKGTASMKLIAACYAIILFAASLGTVGRATTIKRVQSESEMSFFRHSTLLVAASVVWLLRTAYNMACTVGGDLCSRNYNILLGIFFAIWPQFIALCLMFAIITERRNAIWPGKEDAAAEKEKQTPVAVKGPRTPKQEEPAGTILTREKYRQMKKTAKEKKSAAKKTKRAAASPPT
ncbi:hypothetical protein FZEAL_9330 [Fusarium zealandicum]|uniref:Transmembrane protein n=1 Tax=Fusarium zealandicum TaxID=1053134 RepID=A0A8H4XGK4_9HYPO|nr:hypothetical protein FZEAL_9330 [Fusarium zealandicum]